ncbi:hypothetical protein SDC9_49895 [bioreactor metagenome]|uniref:O-antigen ligase-related domain-containing protein n=1 Tax=bioreactor metagenome TaxID=1076179 RepID=A0A644WJG2_9ZZZZ
MADSRSDIFHKLKYPAVIALAIIGIVFSKWLLSVSQFLLLFAVLSDRRSRMRLLEAFRSPLVLSLISVYLLYLAGLLWTSDMKYGLKDVLNKFPMMVFPVLFYAAGPLPKKTAVYLILFFTGCVALLSIISLVNLYLSPVIPERIAIGQSHIRFSLLICLSILMLIHFSDLKEKWFRFSFIPVILVLLYFLFMLESFTGYVVIFMLACFLPFIYRHKIRNTAVRISIIGLLILIVSTALWGIYDVKRNCFPEISKVDADTLEQTTINGYYYQHDTETMLSENGNQVYLFVQEMEMVNAWNHRSSKKIEMNSACSPATNVLMRYLSSKGLRKDSLGVYSLSDQDIKYIEEGYSNYLLPHFDPYRARIYRFLWELNSYRCTGDPSGHSLTQRFEFWRAAVRLIEKHPVFGVGTGDINQAFKDEYDILNSKLKPEYRLRSHNQFLSVAVALGFAGLLVFLFSLTAPFLLHKIPDRKLYIGFIFIFLLSMLNEDTLETQVGVTFYALFNSFLLFILPSNPKSEDEKE